MAEGAESIALPSWLFGRFSLPFLRRGKGAKNQSPRMRRRFRVGKARWIALLMLAGFVFFRFSDPTLLQSLRLKVFDIYQQVKPRPLMENSPVVIVDLDDASLEEIGQWPWPRNVIAQMVANLFNNGVGAAYIDFGQDIWRDETPIAEARVRVVCLDGKGKPRRQPADLVARLKTMLPTRDTAKA